MVDACQAGKWLLYPKLTLAYLMDKLGKIWLSIIVLYNEITSPVTTLYIIMFAPSAQTQAEVGDAKPIAYKLVGLVFWLIYYPLFFLLLNHDKEYLQFFSREIRSWND